jgi:hypothetical protein
MKTTALLAIITAFTGLTVASPIVNQREFAQDPQAWIAFQQNTQEIYKIIQTALFDYQQAAQAAVNANGGDNPVIFTYTSYISSGGNDMLVNLQNVITFLSQQGF